MMEYWVEEDKIFFNKSGQSEIKIKIISVFDTQYSNIPPFHYSIGRLKVNSTPFG
jgi:hypothetical protein